MKTSMKSSESQARKSNQKGKLFIISLVSIFWITLVTLYATGVIEIKSEREQFWASQQENTMSADEIAPMTLFAYEDGLH